MDTPAVSALPPSTPPALAVEHEMVHPFERALLADVIPALGCTEPIAIALACAKAREVLGTLPDRVTLACSGNVIKNALSVIVPNSGGRAGIPIAAALGIIAGRSDAGLECLEGADETDIDAAQHLVDSGRITVELAEGIPGLFISAHVTGGGHEARVDLRDDHTAFRLIQRDGQDLTGHDPAASGTRTPATEPVAPEVAEEPVEFSLEAILDFIDTVDYAQRTALRDTLTQQIETNRQIASAGLAEGFGAQVGRTLLDLTPAPSVAVRARATAAAGSDARMGGCPLPVMISSGSGNQGLTVSIPVIAYAEEVGAAREDLLRALLLSNLVAMYQKQAIGKLSAYCGAVTAAAGAGAGIARLIGLTREQIGHTVINALATASGVVCDGAKPSCAAKVSLSVDNAIAAVEMAKAGRVFQAGDGLVAGDVDATIRNIGRMARDGMRSTDVEILHIMLGQRRS